jgi:signal transduction histidine kinase
VATNLPPGDAVVVLAHEAALSRALMNIITNAEQFAPPGSTVEIAVARDGRHVAVHVLDRGPGVPAHDRARIFEMFWSGRPDGTGLGLFLARAAIEKSGGTLSVANRPDGGADFCVRLEAADD